MICTVPFRTELTTCPYCHSKLVFHRKRKRPVKTASGNFTALHIIMKCSACNMRFRSRKLDSIIGHVTCILYLLDSYKRDNILLKVFKGVRSTWMHLCKRRHA